MTWGLLCDKRLEHNKSCWALLNCMTGSAGEELPPGTQPARWPPGSAEHVCLCVREMWADGEKNESGRAVISVMAISAQESQSPLELVLRVLWQYNFPDRKGIAFPIKIFHKQGKYFTSSSTDYQFFQQIASFESISNGEKHWHRFQLSSPWSFCVDRLDEFMVYFIVLCMC